MRLLRSVCLLAALAAAPCLVRAQESSFGVSGGLNYVGGSASKIGVDIAGTAVTGGDRRGQFASVFLERRSSDGPIALRLEGFFSRLTSGPSTSSVNGQAALRDNTYGIAATATYALRSGSGVRPYLLAGTGIYASSLGTNPDPEATDVSLTKGGMGLGLHLGAGMEGRLGKSRVFAELRYHQALHEVRGAAFMPLVVGAKF